LLAQAAIEHAGSRLTSSGRPRRDAGRRQQVHGDDREQDQQAERHHEDESLAVASPGGLIGPEQALDRLRIFQLFVQIMDFGF
jgi:hypothetical protein